MSDQSRNRNDETHGHGGPGKRLEQKAKPALTPAQAQKRKEKRIMIVMIIAAVIMVIAAAAVVLVNRWFVKPAVPPDPVPTASAGAGSAESLPPDASAEPTLSFEAVEPKVSGERRSQDIFTILIFGSDTTSGLTDTMMVATYDVTNQKATVMSLPRDTLINSSARPGIDAKKLNAVYNVYGRGDRGIEALKSEVSELVGFVPDFYVQIDWELVGEMVDAIGGVWFDNPYHMEYYDPGQNLLIYQEQGYRKLNGDDAMQVVRWRKNNPGVPNGGSGSDIDRLKVQHLFLKAVLKQTLQIGNLTRIGQLIELFNSRVKSDLAVEGMLWFGREAVLGGLQVDDVEFCTMPNALGSYGGRSYIYPIQSELLAKINESLNPFVEQVTIRQLDLMSPNGSGGVRSSTGRLAEPSLAYPPVAESDGPEESGPLESGEPSESGPVESDPVPVESGGQPPESQPAEPDPSAAPGGGPEPVDQGGGDGGAGTADWGGTPD